MSYPTHDTDWATSAKGNHWRRLDGVVLVVGEKKTGGFWARVGDAFLADTFKSKHEAKVAAVMAVPDNSEWRY